MSTFRVVLLFSPLFLLTSSFVSQQVIPLSYKDTEGYWELRRIVDLERNDTSFFEDKREFFVIYGADSPATYLYRSPLNNSSIDIKGKFKTPLVAEGLEKMMNRVNSKPFYLSTSSYIHIVFRSEKREYFFQRHRGPYRM